MLLHLPINCQGRLWLTYIIESTENSFHCLFQTPHLELGQIKIMSMFCQTIDTILFENDTLNIVLSPYILERKDEKKGITCIDYATFTYSQRKFIQSIDIPYIVPFIKIKYTIGLSNYVFLFRYDRRLRYKLITYDIPSMRIYK